MLLKAGMGNGKMKWEIENEKKIFFHFCVLDILSMFNEERIFFIDIHVFF